MPVDFTRSVGWAAAQARQQALQQQQQFQNQQALADQAAANQAGNHNVASAFDDFEKRRALEKQHAYDQAVGAGALAATEGREAPQGTTDEITRGAGLGYSQGRLAVVTQLAKNAEAARAAEAQRAGAQDLARLNAELGTQRDEDRITAELLAKNDPETQRLALERIAARGKNQVAAARAGNPALTTGAQTKADEGVMAGARRGYALRNSLSSLDQLSDKDFGIAGGAHNLVLQGRKMGSDAFNALGLGGMAQKLGLPLTPEEGVKLEQINTFRADMNRMFNALLAEASGKAVTDQELRRKLAEFNMSFSGGPADIGLLFNDRAAMRTAIQRAIDVEDHLQRYIQEARSGDVKSQVDASTVGPEGVGQGTSVLGTNGQQSGGGYTDQYGTFVPGQYHQDSPSSIGRFTPETPMSDLPEAPPAEYPFANEPPTYEPTVSGAAGSPAEQAPPTQSAPPAAPPPKAVAKPAAKKPKPKASRGETLAQTFTAAGGKFDAKGFYEAAREEGLSDDEIHAVLDARGVH